MKIENLQLKNNIFLAPMAGVTDMPFRVLCKEQGCGLVYTEMVSAKGIHYNDEKSFRLTNLAEEEKPAAVQIFGSDPHIMAGIADRLNSSDASIIDINMGCPTPKIIKNGEGSALLRDLPRVQAIAAAVVKAVDIPVTVKIRLGWNDDEIVAPELARRIEAVGVQMLTLHARTREQFYSGQANWAWIRKVKSEVTIPVIGNGDIFVPEDAYKMIEQTGCDGVMIGRGALGNPWLIRHTQYFLKHGTLLPEPSIEERFLVAMQHFDRVLRYKGERIGLNEMRKHAVWYIKGVRNAAQLRDVIMQTRSPEEMRAVMSRILPNKE